MPAVPEIHKKASFIFCFLSPFGSLAGHKIGFELILHKKNTAKLFNTMDKCKQIYWKRNMYHITIFLFFCLFCTYKCLKISALLLAYFGLRQFYDFLSKTLHVFANFLTVESIKVFFGLSDRFCSKIRSKKCIIAPQFLHLPLNCIIYVQENIDQRSCSQLTAALQCHICKKAW